MINADDKFMSHLENKRYEHPMVAQCRYDMIILSKDIQLAILDVRVLANVS